MTTMRKTALAAGILYIATFVFSIPALGFYDSVLNDPNFVFGSGSDDGVLWGGLFEVLTGLTGIGTAVVLHPVVKRYSQSAAIGFVASRTLEAAMIFAGVFSVLAIYTMRQDYAGATGAEASALLMSSNALVAIKDWTFLLGPGLMAIINALCLAPVMYRSGLVPRIIPTLGLIGVPLAAISFACTLFGVFDQVSGPAMLLILPIATWEFSLGVYMTVKGFRKSAVTAATKDDVRSLSTVGA